MKDRLPQIRDLIESHSSFIVFSHIRPDGDAYGTSIALALILRALGKEAVVYNDDGLLQSYAFLPGSELVQKTPEAAPPAGTAVIAVDTSTLARIGDTFTAWKRTPDLNLDHHTSNPGYGRINLINDESPASSQVLYELVEALDLPCPREAATNLYIGIMTDTGSFRFRQTTERTFQVAGALIRRGVDPAWAAQQCYQSSSIERFNLQRDVLSATRFAADNRIAHYRLTAEMYAKTGARADEVENFLDLLQTVSTVEAAFMLEELPDGKMRASLRSRGKVDVNAIAAKFGGGGHKLAAGLRSSLPMEDLEKELLAEMKQALGA